MNTRVEELFHQLAQLSPQARADFFASHAVDPRIRTEVESLLHFDSSPSEFLVRDIGMAASRALPLLDAPGWLCGPYRLLELIGRGGMGAVYLAERSDGEVAQRVAVKLLPPGAGYPQRERFLQERQILAALTHPNIAHMLDAGHLENGQPFLAMEYVEGKPIDTFAAGLPLRRKIGLFLKVCAAVAYLHRNLVVHRDLKPANILVTPDGEPKLLDFGIAKMLDLATDSTITGLRVLTPDYASPEQVTGGLVSTATDIYSLGAVLYLLLTGKSPHEFVDHSSEAIAVTITTREIARPARWAPELKGDLEAILIKALRKLPRERYATVEQFADDLEAFLASRPVRARSANFWYRSRKFVRRHWMPVSAALAVIFSLAAGLYIAERQRTIAEDRVAQLRRLSWQLLEFGSQLSGPNAGSDLKLHHKIAATSIQYLESLPPEVLRDKQLALEIGTGYLRLARIQGVPEWNQQGQHVEAEKSLNKAWEIAKTVLAADPTNREALWQMSNVEHDHAVIAYVERRPEEVIAWSRQAVEGFDRLARLGHLTRKEINGATYIYGDLAEIHTGLHQFEDAVRYAQLGIDYSRNTSTVPGPRAQAFNMLAGALTYRGDFQGAQEAVRQARQLWEQLRRDEGDTRYTRLILNQTRCREGLLLGEEGGVNLNRPHQAAVRLREAFEALEIFAKTAPDDYQSRTTIAVTGHYLGDLLRHTSPKRALAVYDYSLMRIREVPNDVAARRLEVLLLAGSSYAARWMHRESNAMARIEAAFRLLRDAGDYPAAALKPGSEADIAVRALADHYAETGRLDQAIQSYWDLRRVLLVSNPDARSDLLNAVSLTALDGSLAALLRRVGAMDQTAALKTSNREIWRRWNRQLPNNSFVLRELAAAGSP